MNMIRDSIMQTYIVIYLKISINRDVLRALFIAGARTTTVTTTNSNQISSHSRAMSRAASNATHRYLDDVLSDRSNVSLSYDIPSRGVIRGQLLELTEVRNPSSQSSIVYSPRTFVTLRRPMAR